MRYAKYVKEAIMLIIMITLSISTVKNMRAIKEMENNLEQTKNNLYQTNQVIAEMQKKVFETTFATNYSSVSK